MSNYIGSTTGQQSPYLFTLVTRFLALLTLYYTVQKELKDEDIHFLQIISSILPWHWKGLSFMKKTLLEREMSDTILNSISDV